MAGLGECCSHVGAVLFFLQYICLKKSESEKSVTDVSAYWVTPSKKNIEPKKISSIDFSHPKTIDPHCSLTYKSKTDLIKILPKTLQDNDTFHNFLSKLEKINSNAGILKVVSPYNLKFKINSFPKSFNGIYKDENALLSREELITLGSSMDFSLTVNDCNKIEELTRLQSQSKEWFLYRSGRITASRVKDVCSVKTYNSNISLIKSICYPLNNKFKNAATEWGNTNESNGRIYTLKN